MTLVLVGLLSLLSQVVMLRELNVAFYGIELVYLVALAAWLAGTAVGAATLPRLPGSARAAAWLLVAAAVLLPVDVAAVRASRQLLHGVPGAYLPLDRQGLIVILSVVPLGWLFGLAFRWAASERIAGGGTLAAAYALESLGAALGGLASTVAFRAGASNATVAAAGSVLVVAAIAASPGAGAMQMRRAGVVILLGMAAVGLPHVGAADAWMTRWSHPGLVETRDTPYARVTVTRTDGQVSVFENDVLTFESESAENEELPHLAALQHPSPGRVLLLGGGAEGLDVQLRRHHPASLEHVEIDGRGIAIVRRSLGYDAAGHEPPIIADPRAYLARDGGQAAGTVPGHPRFYDLIVIALPEPVSGQTNRFYTREFFQQCAARLAPAGVVAFRLRMPENYLAPVTVLRAASIAQALTTVFRCVDFLPGLATTVLASNVPLAEPAEITRRLHERHLEARLVTERYVDYVYAGDRRPELRRALLSAQVPPNADARPICYFFASLGWLSKFVPQLLASTPGGLSSWPRTWGWLAGAATLLLLAACRRRPGTRRAALALCAGAAGMALETVVLLDYQAKNGALFEDLGVLVMAFMLGSAGGAWAMRDVRRQGRRRIALLIVGLAASSLLVAWVVAAGVRVGLPGSAVLLAAGGALVAALFAEASRIGSTREAGPMGRLYAADLAGGCLGGLVASLVLVPLAGLDTTALLTAALVGLAIVLV